MQGVYCQFLNLYQNSKYCYENSSTRQPCPVAPFFIAVWAPPPDFAFAAAVIIEEGVSWLVIIAEEAMPNNRPHLNKDWAGRSRA
jgi:hypothetical protein